MQLAREMTTVKAMGCNSTLDDIRREYLTQKSCAPRCTVSCVQQISMVDNWRDPQTFSPASGGGQPASLIQLQPSSRPGR